MGKNKSKKRSGQTYDVTAIRNQIRELFAAAKDLEKGVEVPQEHLQVLLIAGTESIDRLQAMLGRSALQSIGQKMRGYQFQLALTKEFVNEKAVSLACTAKQLDYALDSVEELDLGSTMQP